MGYTFNLLSHHKPTLASLGGVKPLHALDPKYSGQLGVDVDGLYISQPDTGEQAMEIVEELVRSGAIDVIVLDSVAALVPRAEIEGEMGDSHDLPRGSTPIDFAYRIHTEVGDRCRGARVNGKVVPLDYQLQSGDVVDIYTITQGGPNLDWLDESLNYVHTNRAKTAIRNWFRKREKQENIYEGRKALDNKLKQLNVSDQEETYVNNYKHPAYDNHERSTFFSEIHQQ